MIQQADVIYIKKDLFSVGPVKTTTGEKIAIIVRMEDKLTIREVRVEMTPDTAIKLSQALNITCEIMGNEGKTNDNDRE